MVVACLLGSVSTPLLRAQIRSATIVGTVMDPAGSAVAGADVVVTNLETNIGFKTKTTDAGQFAVPYLPQGVYAVSVTASGFSPYRQSEITLGTAQALRIDINLKVGTVESTIEVTAQAARVQTDTTSVSGATQSKVIDLIPNISQNPIYYAILQAGVQPRNATADTTSNNSFGIGVNGRRQYSAIGINGGRAFTNDIQLDGLPVMGGGYNEAAVIPNTEGLQEVRVISNNFSAKYGHGQGVISMSTKSGTNQYHGQGAWDLRNEALNANTNSNNANGIRRSPFKVNEFGGSVTGPIIKDKLFFSSSYHFLMFNRGVTSLLTVPTDIERKGDFSNTFIRDTNGSPVPAQIYDPFSVTQLGPDLYQRTPFPNATIPNPDKYAVLMYGFYPSPNRTPDDAFQTNNYTAGTVNTTRRHSLNNRIDYRRGAHSFYASGGIGYGKILQPRPFGKSPFNGAPSETSDKNPYGQIGDTVVLSPTLLLDIRYGITRINTKDFAGDKSGFTDYDAFGVPKPVQALMMIRGAAPTVVPNNFSGGSGGGSAWTALSAGQFATKHEQQTSHVLSASIAKTRGKWTHKAGTEIRTLLSNYADLEEASVAIASCCAHVGGNYTFQYVTADGSSAAQNTVPAQRGVNGAALLTGSGIWWIRPGANLLPAFAQKYFAIYSQNDWRASSKLTLNLGLRWDLQAGPTERYNRMAAMDLTQKTPFGTQGTWAFPGAQGYSRNLWETQYNNWGPRAGAAYQLTSSMVLRGGFGITYLPSNTGYFSGPNDYGSTPFGTGTNMIPYGTTPHGVPVGTFSTQAAILPVVGANPADPSVYGVSEARFDRYLKNGRAMQWNFFVEKAFLRNWSGSVGYSASHSDNLPNRNYPFQSIQNLPSSTLSGWRDQFISSNGTLNPANVQVKNPWQPANGSLLPFAGTLAGATVPQYVTMLPYPLLFGNSSRINDSRGYASYHSLQARLSHAFANGFQMDANYTWSKELDYTTTAIEDGQGFNSGGTASAPDLLNLRNNKKYGFSDQPHRFVGVMLYESPFGSGKRLEIRNRILRSIAGDWHTGAVVTLQSGMPIAVSGASDGASVARPNRVAGQPLEVPKELQRWYDGATAVTLPCGRVVTPSKNTFLKYNTCAFAGQVVGLPNGNFQTDQFWVGNSAQTIGDLRGPGRINVDMSLRRIFAIRESLSLEVSAEVANILNSAEYSGNYTGALGGTNVTTNAAKGLKPGMGSSDTYGTIGLTTFDPRQVTMHVRIRF
jgi:hypothetical protein